MMKKLFLVALTLVLLAGLTACNPSGSSTSEKTYKIGFASVTSMSASDAVGGEEAKDGQLQQNVTYALIVLDGDTIVYLGFDTAQNSAKFDATGTITSDTPKVTKKELKEGYGMAAVTGGLEWYEQIAALEEFAVGKTLAEFLAEPTEIGEEGHPVFTGDIASSVSISVDAFLEAAEKAGAAAVEVKGISSAGFASITSISASSATTGDEGTAGSVTFNTSMAALAFDKDGKIVWASFDVAQTSRNTITAEGVATANTDLRTKMEKQGDYGMAAASPIGKEWYEQGEALNAYAVGKTLDEFLASPTEIGEEGSPVFTGDIASSVSISVGDLLEAAAKIKSFTVEIK
ncbi:MAG: hypothetical protein LBR25_00920 [Erysipelotrichaceae bacterium]|nr:hypothetical protein [Erysipelotrichaceae bacterium]